MQQYFALQSAELHSDLLAQANSDAADAQGDAPAGASVVVEADKAALAGAGDGLQLPKSALQPLTDEQFRKLDEKSEAFMAGESTRQRFGNLLQAMDLQGPGLEVASTGKVRGEGAAGRRVWRSTPPRWRVTGVAVLLPAPGLTRTPPPLPPPAVAGGMPPRRARRSGSSRGRC